MSLHRLQSLVYLAVAVVVPAVVDLRHVGIQGCIPVVAVANGRIGQVLTLGAIPLSIAPPVPIQIDAVQPTGGPWGIGADGGSFGLLHGLTAGVGGFGGTGKQQDEGDHGRGVA